MNYFSQNEFTNSIILLPIVNVILRLVEYGYITQELIQKQYEQFGQN